MAISPLKVVPPLTVLQTVPFIEISVQAGDFILRFVREKLQHVVNRDDTGRSVGAFPGNLNSGTRYGKAHLRSK